MKILLQILLLGTLTITQGKALYAESETSSKSDFVRCKIDAATLGELDIQTELDKFQKHLEQVLKTSEAKTYSMKECDVEVVKEDASDIVNMTATIPYKTEEHGLLRKRWDGRIVVRHPFLRSNETWIPLADFVVVSSERKPPIPGSWELDRDPDLRGLAANFRPKKENLL